MLPDYVPRLPDFANAATGIRTAIHDIAGALGLAETPATAYICADWRRERMMNRVSPETGLPR